MGVPVETRRSDLQRRLDDALRLTAEHRARSRFSSFAAPTSPDYWSDFLRIGADGGFGGLEAVLDRFDALRGEADPAALRHALLSYLVHHVDLNGLGLRLPSLAERRPGATRPSFRNGDDPHG
ncbi:MAG: hypothetical protein WA418_33075 [Bradyrhizobium sp.]